MIQFRNVSVCYEKHRLHPVPSLEDLDLQVGPGELVFLVGPSGAGKSTLLKLVIGEVRADFGQVVVEGEDVTHYSDHQLSLLRRKIGVVFQDFQLLQQKTAWENVAFALRVIGVPQSRIVKEVPRALETVGIAHRAHAYPHELSGGEQQRVAIARAIVNAPHILLADEPTGNLDPETAAQIGELLTRINAELKTTVVMATHDRTLVDALRRRVVRLGDGRLISDENPGVYHPEDDLEPAVPVSPSSQSELSNSLQIQSKFPDPGLASPSASASLAREELPEEPVPVCPSEPASTLGAKPPEPEVSEPSPRTDPNVAAALGNHAPLGSPENPIIQYGR